jgi:hypothetical protein
VVLAVVGALLAACCIGGSAAAYLVERGLPDVSSADEASQQHHRQPPDPCALLDAAALRVSLGEVATSSAYKDTGCDYALSADPADPNLQARALHLAVEVSAQAGQSFQRALQSGPRRHEVDCGEEAYSAAQFDTGKVGDASLWCHSGDVYLTLLYHGFDYNGGRTFDATLAGLGRAALGKVPTA